MESSLQVISLILVQGIKLQKFYLTAEVKWSRPLVDEGWYFIGFELFEGDSTDYRQWYDWVDSEAAKRQA